MKVVVDLRISQKTDNGRRKPLTVGDSSMEIVRLSLMHAYGNSSSFDGR